MTFQRIIAFSQLTWHNERVCPWLRPYLPDWSFHTDEEYFYQTSRSSGMWRVSKSNRRSFDCGFSHLHPFGFAPKAEFCK